MDNLKKSRTPVKAALTRFKNHIDSCDSLTDKENLRARLAKHELLFEKYDAIQSQIENLCIDDDDESAEQARERETFENMFFDTIAKVKRLIAPSAIRRTASSEPSLTRDVSSHSLGVNLPKINIPTYDGAYGGWLKFRDTFQTLIHENPNLSNIQKFHYLHSSLTGDALNAIEGLGICEANYEIAWNSLCKRYEDTDALIHHHVRGLFELPQLTRESHNDLRQLLDNINNHLLSLKALGEKVEHWDVLIIYILTSKLNQSIKREWEKNLTHGAEKVRLVNMTEFLEKHCRYLHKMLPDKSISTDNKSNKSQNAKFSNTKSFATTTKGCASCNAAHPLYACDNFKQMSPSARVQRVQELKLCFNCLSSGHQNKNCTRGPCRKCGKRHNTLLHLDTSVAPSQSLGTNAIQSMASPNVASLKTCTTQVATSASNYVLLATALINVYDKHGNKHDCRVLLDSCSQAHIISSALCRKLGLQRTKTAISLTGVDGISREISQRATLKLKSRLNDFTATITGLVLDEISDNLPNPDIQHIGIETPRGIELADPEYRRSRPVDMLIGAGLFFSLLAVGQCRLGSGQPTFQKTVLGWIATGNLKFAPQIQYKATCHLIKNEQLNKQLEKFWNIEHSYMKRDHPNKNDYCEQHFEATTTRNEKGRFVVSIPFNNNVNKLGESRESALKLFYSLERRFKNNVSLKKQYTDFMTEYASLGHMSQIPDAEVTTCPHYYMPHHAVFKDSTTSSIRVVYNASKPTSSGKSANDAQYIGPPVQDELFTILIRFRKFRYVLSADIAKMYRQILIKPEERKMQRILWREDPSLPVRDYELNTVTYGTASASFLATRCLEQISRDCEKQNPIESQVIRHDFYVDDLLTGSETIEEAVALKQNLTKILMDYGMDLRKWASNEQLIMSTNKGANPSSVDIQGTKEPKTLGLLWQPNSDQLEYRVDFTNARKTTKRTVASIIAQIFDPLGLVGPAIIQAKIIMQRLWELKINWDESLPQDVHSLWAQTYAQLADINKISVARHVSVKNCRRIEFHGFCDASEQAYGACIYVCSIDKEDKRITHILCAKSRVAPLKSTTIPRLELLGATLLAQLASKVASAYHIGMEQWYFWSDSMIVLSWIKAPSRKWKTFVANRVAEIQDLTNENWNHVETAMNPADLISRGTTAAELRDSNLWWRGPSWLSNKPSEWPIVNNTALFEAPEQRSYSMKLTTKLANEEQHTCQDERLEQPIKLELFDKFSSFTKLVRVTAYMRKFILICKSVAKLQKVTDIKNGKSTVDRDPTTLTFSEIKDATDCLLKRAQSESFTQELACMQKGKELPKTSRLNQLKPFVDSFGLLRVGGRLSNSTLSRNEMHPIILSSNHKFTYLLIKHEHLRLLHAGCQSVLSSLRKQYWPICGKNTVKKVLKQCIPCFRSKPVTVTHLMGDLPASRVTPTRAFFNCGVDYAGPFLIKERPRARVSIKAYICIFVCFSTKAVHIELATDLSTDAFLNCLRRFISRRGRCKAIYSDNGTNFVGARNELNELQELIKTSEFKENIANLSANEGIEWHFIPPRAPHFGGLWESAVKSAKYHLKRVVGETRLTYEELYTILTQVEACLNSRPLSPLSNDPNDLTPLTPAHFLIGDSLLAAPQADLRELNTNRLNRYQHLQQMVQHFWKRWLREYLPQLQTRTKWPHSTPTVIKPGTMVIMKEDNTPPTQWPLGRVTETHPGKDDVIRVVSIRTTKGIIKRPTAKICILPIDN